MNTTSIVAPSLIGKHIKSPKVKPDKDRQEIDDEPYRQYLEDYREDLINGLVYMLGDHPRED